MSRFFVDGCFDSYHFAHVHLLYQAKQLCDKLIVGTHSDDEMIIHKNKPINTFEDRILLLKYCKYIDTIVKEPVDYITNEKTLTKYNCEKFVHGYENVITKNNIDALQEIKESGKYIPVQSTIGISTTNLLYRIKCQYDNVPFNTCLDTVYLKNILDKVEYKIKFDRHDNVLFCVNDYDLFNRRHLEVLLQYKQQVKDSAKIVAVIKRTDSIKYIYNKLETAIVLNSISIIDKVIYYEDLEQAKKYNSSSQVIEFNTIYEYPDFSLYEEKYNKEVLKNNKFKKLKEEYLDTNLYNDILQTQFENLNKIINTLTFKENDIIVFDIDEVVLSNLPYVNDYNYSYLSTPENIEKGECILIEQCKNTFEIINTKNIKYAFITGRKEYLRKITINNLEKYNLKNYQKLYLCPNNFIGDVQDFKLSCRKDLSEKFNIVYNIGDQLSDLIGGYSENELLIFNPFYKTVNK